MKLVKQFFTSLIACASIVLIVVFLMLFGVVPYSSQVLTAFLIGAGLLVVGQTIFLVAIDEGIIKLGKLVGTFLMKKKKVWLIVVFGFLFGLVTTIAEPDVQVLVGEIVSLNPFISSWLLLSICAIGCGLFVCFALVRILKNIPLKWVLLVLYGIIILLSFFTPNMYIGIAFDMGGVTTGSVTVPFILALATGICAIRSGKTASDTFGVIAIATAGPILAMMVLGMVVGEPATNITQTVQTLDFGSALLTCMQDVALAFLPLLVIFLISQGTMLKLSLKQFLKILLGFVISAVGLVVFLTGITYGFTAMGHFIGQTISGGFGQLGIVLFGVLISLMFVFTDPSIVVVVNQVEEITSGLLKKSVVFITLGIGIALAGGLSLLYVLYQINLLFILVPLYLVILILNFCIPSMFTALAFDSGGVASGTMTVAFLFPICVGLTQTLNIEGFSGFGVVGIIATVPILTMQILGLIFTIKRNIARRKK